MSTTRANGETTALRVAVLSYERPDMLAEALASLCAQDHEDWLATVIDDSPDPGPGRAVTADIGDSRISYVARPAPHAQYLSTTDAVALAPEGRYFTLLHDDDRWHPTLASTLLARLDADPALVAAFCNEWLIDTEGDIDHAATRDRNDWMRRPLLRPGRHQPFRDLVIDRQIPFVKGTIIRSSALSSYVPEPWAGDSNDQLMGMELAASGGGVWYEDQRLFDNRQHDGTLTAMRSTVGLKKVHTRLWQTYADDPRYAAERDLLLARVHDSQSQLAALELRHRGAAAARRTARAVLAQGWDRRAAVVWGASLLPPALRGPFRPSRP